MRFSDRGSRRRVPARITSSACATGPNRRQGWPISGAWCFATVAQLRPMGRSLSPAISLVRGRSRGDGVGPAPGRRQGMAERQRSGGAPCRERARVLASLELNCRSNCRRAGSPKLLLHACLPLVDDLAAPAVPAEQKLGPEALRRGDQAACCAPRHRPPWVRQPWHLAVGPMPRTARAPAGGTIVPVPGGRQPRDGEGRATPRRSVRGGVRQAAEADALQEGPFRQSLRPAADEAGPLQ